MGRFPIRISCVVSPPPIKTVDRRTAIDRRVVVDGRTTVDGQTAVDGQAVD